MIMWVQPSAAWSPAAWAAASTAWPAGLAIGPVPLVAQEPGLTFEDLPRLRGEARRGGLGDRPEQDLVLGLGPVHLLRLTGQPLGHHAPGRAARA